MHRKASARKKQPKPSTHSAAPLLKYHSFIYSTLHTNAAHQRNNNLTSHITKKKVLNAIMQAISSHLVHSKKSGKHTSASASASASRNRIRPSPHRLQIHIHPPITTCTRSIHLSIPIPASDSLPALKHLLSSLSLNTSPLHLCISSTLTYHHFIHTCIR